MDEISGSCKLLLFSYQSESLHFSPVEIYRRHTGKNFDLSTKKHKKESISRDQPCPIIPQALQLILSELRWAVMVDLVKNMMFVDSVVRIRHVQIVVSADQISRECSRGHEMSKTSY